MNLEKAPVAGTYKRIGCGSRRCIIRDVLVRRNSRSLQGTGFLLVAFRCRTRRSCNRHEAPLQPAHGFRRVRVTPSWLRLFLRIIRRSSSYSASSTEHSHGSLQAWLEILIDLICDQALFCFVLQKHRLVSGRCTLELQVNRPGLNVENGRSVHGNAKLLQKRELPAVASSGFPLSARFMFLGAQG